MSIRSLMRSGHWYCRVMNNTSRAKVRSSRSLRSFSRNWTRAAPGGNAARAVASTRSRLRGAAAWRSALATRDMQNMGLAPVAHIEGGFAQWRESGLPVITPEPKTPEISEK